MTLGTGDELKDKLQPNQTKRQLVVKNKCERA